MRLAGNPETKQMLGHIRVVGNDPHAESLGTLGHHASDTAQPHDPQGLVGQLQALPTWKATRSDFTASTVFVVLFIRRGIAKRP
jgi:hypothetical protein